jgi:predicted kinase
MMIGMPASGKSTLVDKLKSSGAKVVSTDNVIEGIAKGAGTTYDDIFSHAIDYAGTVSKRMMEKHVKAGHDIVSDQTNLSKKSRASKLAMVPNNYTKIAVHVATPPEAEHKKRLASREGKTIPDHVMKTMAKNYNPPTHEEGFHEIHHYDHEGKLLGITKHLNHK